MHLAAGGGCQSFLPVAEGATSPRREAARSSSIACLAWYLGGGPPAKERFARGLRGDHAVLSLCPPAGSNFLPSAGVGLA